MRLRPTRTWPSTTAQEMPGMAPRAMAVSASAARDADGAAPTTRSAGGPGAEVPRLVERGRAAVDVAAHVGSQVQQDLVADRARARDRRAAAVRHDAQPVLLREPQLGLAVPRLSVAAEAVLGVTNPVPGHLGEV